MATFRLPRLSDDRPSTGLRDGAQALRGSEGRWRHPPCIRHLVYSPVLVRVPGALHGVPFLVFAPHRGAFDGWDGDIKNLDTPTLEKFMHYFQELAAQLPPDDGAAQIGPAIDVTAESVAPGTLPRGRGEGPTGASSALLHLRGSHDWAALRRHEPERNANAGGMVPGPSAGEGAVDCRGSGETPPSLRCFQS